MDKQELIQIVQDLTKQIGRAPLFREFDAHVVGGQSKVRKMFGTFNNMLKEAGVERAAIRPKTEHTIFEAAKIERKFEKTYKVICGKREQIQGFFRTTLDLAELFARAGNPTSLKISAQPDTHVKFMDVPAVNCYLHFLKYYKPDVHIIMGDFVDCEGLSHWPDASLEPRRIVPEMKQARDLLLRLNEATPSCSTRIYLEGNHENWIVQALGKMPELFDGLAELDIEISLRTLLGLDKYGYTLFKLNELVQIGKAHFTHGLYEGAGHALKHVNELKCNLYYGHLHDTQEANRTGIEGNCEAASLGCLCRLDAKFLKGRPNNWVHAHGVFEVFPDGTYTFYKPRIIAGRMSYNGIVFDGN